MVKFDSHPINFWIKIINIESQHGKCSMAEYAFQVLSIYPQQLLNIRVSNLCYKFV